MRPLGILVLFVALTITFAYPLSFDPGNVVVPGDADTELFMWTLAWNTHALVTRPWDIFNANIYYPLPHTLAFSENLIGTLPFAAPVIWLTGNHVLALNAVALSSVLLCGLGGYVLARRLGTSRPAAIVCGIIFAFSPARFYRYGQLHLTTVQWIPFVLAYLHTYFTTRRPRDLWIAAAFLTLQVLTTGHGAVYAGIAVAIVLGVHIVGSRPLQSSLQTARDFGWRGLLILLPAALLFIPYRLVQREAGLRRTLANWAATPESFLASPSHAHIALHTWLIGRNVNETATAFMFPGWLPILLGLVALAAGWRAAPKIVASYALIVLFSVLLAVGEPLSLWPFVYWMPGLNFIRVPSRFIILTVLALAVLAAFGFDAVRRKLPARLGTALVPAAIALLVVEFATMPFSGTPYRVVIPAVDRMLADRPGSFAIAEIPVQTADRWHSTYMLHSMAHWQKTVHGHSGIRVPLHDELFAQLREFPDAEGIAHLQRLGVDYLVVHTEAYEPGEWPQIEKRLAQFPDDLSLEMTVGTGRIYAIRQLPGAVQ